MKPETESELSLRKWQERELAAHRWRVEHWETIKGLWCTGLTCPHCHADHCEVDSHSC